VDPILLAAGKEVLTRLDEWRTKATADAQDDAARDAANWIFAGSLALATAEQLRLRFLSLMNEIEALTVETPAAERAAVADRVRDLGQSQLLVGRLAESVGMLRKASEQDGPVRKAIAKTTHDDHARAESLDVVWQLANLAEEVLRWVGVHKKAPTPEGVGDVAVALRAAHDAGTLKYAQDAAQRAFMVIDDYELLRARYRLGQLRSHVTAAYKLLPPPPVDVE
jgi:hypothetical protein